MGKKKTKLKRSSKSHEEHQPLAKRIQKSSHPNEVPNNSPLDEITKSPGLVHIAEQIFVNLNQEDLKKCKKVNKHWKGIVKTPRLLFKACVHKGIFIY